MLQIESRVSRHQQVPLAAFMAQAPNTIVSRPMLAMSRIVADDGFQVPDFKSGVSHVAKVVYPYKRIFIGPPQAERKLKAIFWLGFPRQEGILLVDGGGVS